MHYSSLYVNARVFVLWGVVGVTVVGPITQKGMEKKKKKKKTRNFCCARCQLLAPVL